MLRLAIVTPHEETLTLDCNEVIVPGSTGDIGLLPGHLPLVSSLRPGVLTVVEDSRRRPYAVGTGYAEIAEDTVTVLTEQCLSADQIDVEAARADLEQAEREMAGKGPEDPAFAELDLGARWARTRIEVRERR